MLNYAFRSLFACLTMSVAHGMFFLRCMSHLATSKVQFCHLGVTCHVVGNIMRECVEKRSRCESTQGHFIPSGTSLRGKDLHNPLCA